MNLPVLQSKLSMPNADSLLSRQALISRLNDYSQHNLTVITAPSGYGKTSLVVDWINHSRHSCCWFSIDDKNNVPSSFWLYICAGLKRIDESISEKAELFLQNSYIEDFSIITDTLLESLEKFTRKYSRPAQLVMVFDDFHHIDDPKILDSFNRFLDYLPAWIHVVITSRNLPSLKIPARRSKLKANILLTQDLAFDASQIEAFLQTRLSLKLNKEQVSTLFEKTEGWAAAIQLAGLALKSNGDIESLNHDSSASFHKDNFLSGFLFEEVFLQLSEELRQLLLAVSVVDSFNVELSDFLLQTNSGQANNSQVLIHQLLESGLFVTVLDARQNWYRLHSLFQEWLYSQLLKSSESAVIKQRACDWFSNNENYDQALDLALDLQNYTHAAYLMRCLYPSAKHVAHYDHALKRLAEFPVHIIKELPHLSILKGSIYLHFYRYEETQIYINYVEQALQSFEHNSRGNQDLRLQEIKKMGLDGEDDLEILTTGIKVLQSQMARFHGDGQLAKKLDQEIQRSSQQASQQESQQLLCWAYYGAAADAFNNDEIGECVHHGKIALDLARKSDDASCVVATLSWLLPALNFNGQLKLALELGEKNLQWLEKRSLLHLPNIYTVYLVMVAIYMEVNRLDQAWALYHSLLQREGDFDEPRETTFSKNYTHVQLLSLSGLPEQTQVSLEKLKQFEASHFPEGAAPGEFNFSTLPDANTLWALIELKTGNFFPIIQWANESPSLEKHNCLMRFEFEQLIYAAGRMLVGEDMDDYLSEIQQRSKERGVIAREIGCYLVSAKVLQGFGNIEEALVYFTKAISLAAPCGYVNLILEGSDLLKPLLEKTIEVGIEVDYCQMLLTQIELSKDRNYTGEPQLVVEPSLKENIQEPFNSATEALIIGRELDQSNLIERLSARELEVLGLLSKGQRNKEIAEQLNLSVSTIKRHLQNIYGKLQVGSRTEALVQFNKRQ